MIRCSVYMSVVAMMLMLMNLNVGMNSCEAVGFMESATMARRAPFPFSSIPVYIEHLLKLLCVNSSIRHVHI